MNLFTTKRSEHMTKRKLSTYQHELCKAELEYIRWRKETTCEEVLSTQDGLVCLVWMIYGCWYIRISRVDMWTSILNHTTYISRFTLNFWPLIMNFNIAYWLDMGEDLFSSGFLVNDFMHTKTCERWHLIIRHIANHINFHGP